MISFINFSKKYNNKYVFSECNFDILDNRISFFMGPNGSGKTTLIKCLLGLEAFEGQISIDGSDIEEARKDFLVIWDDCPFYMNLKGIENLHIFSEGLLSKKHIEQMASKYLDYSTLRRRVQTYSYGQKKKLSLCLIDILNPKVIIMDEISNGLDYEMMKSLRMDIKRIAKEKTIILTGHQFGFYNGIVEDIFVLNDQKILLERQKFDESNETLEEVYEQRIH